jgi:hypothetical protein
MGIHNSSLTRVRPFFKTLLRRDPDGSTWLPRLLALAPNTDLFGGTDLLSNPGLLREANVDPERRLHPPEAFLRWLIQNPGGLAWPDGGRAGFGTETQNWREKLMGRRDLSNEPRDRHLQIRKADRQDAIARGLKELPTLGAAGSERKWWAFEGCTSVDCYLATDRLQIYVEGKRTDILSPSRDWYPSRNQLIRNLESARADAAATPFACLLIAEERLSAVPLSRIQASLPHLLETEQCSLMRHFLGSITWREACDATGVDYDELPATA